MIPSGWFIVATIVLALVGCDGDSPSPPLPASPTSPTPTGTEPPVVQGIVISLESRTLTVGEDQGLTAEATFSDGSTGLVTDGVWESDNPDVATVEAAATPSPTAQAIRGEAVVLRAVGPGSARISVDASDVRGTVDVQVLPPMVIPGTLFVDPDIVTSSDPSTFVSVAYRGRGSREMFDRRRSAFVTYHAFLFDASYSDGFAVEIQVNPEFQTQEAARREARKYGRLIGQLPRVLRGERFRTVWIHKGVELFGGGNNNVLIHTGQAELYQADGLLEEVFVHEASHTSLDDLHATAPGWQEAQRADDDFISTYARDNPTREDVAESFPMWLALRYREDRISPRLAATIRARIPNRLIYLDEQRFPMNPVR